MKRQQNRLTSPKATNKRSSVAHIAQPQRKASTMSLLSASLPSMSNSRMSSPTMQRTSIMTHYNTSPMSNQYRPMSNPAMRKNMLRSTASIYRDCLRLIDHMAGKSRKGDRMRELLQGEFRKNADITDPAKIETLKGHAIQGLANYLTVESLARSNKKFSPVVDGRIEVPLASRVSDERQQQMQSSFTHHQQLLKDSQESDQAAAASNQDVEYRGVDLNRSFKDYGKNIDELKGDSAFDKIVDAVGTNDKTGR